MPAIDSSMREEADRATTIGEVVRAARASIACQRLRESGYPENTAADVAEITASRETARRYLVEIGIIDESGRLRPEYRSE